MLSQFLPWLTQLRGTHGMRPQTLLSPAPPQTSPLLHEPQFIVRPQPSLTLPQFFLCATQDFGVQPQTPIAPPPPQVS